jgi:thiol-disulfide isomerase/thioredoxin
LTGIDGKEITNKQMPKSKFVCIIIFSPDCSHCEKEAADLNKYADKFKNVVFVWDSYRDMELIKKFAENLSVLDKVNGANISNIANGLQTLKSTLGDDLKSQVGGVNDFAKAVDTLSKSVGALGTSMSALDINKLKDAITGVQGPGGGGSAGGAGAGGAAATNPATANAEKLNTLVTELITVTKEVRDFNKDQVDAIRQRGSAMGGK